MPDQVRHDDTWKDSPLLRSMLLASTALLLSACATTQPETLVAPPLASAEAPAPAPAPAPIPRNSELAALFDAHDKAELALSPLFKAYRGIKDKDYGKWDEFTDAAHEAERALDRQTLATMRSRFDRAALNADDQLSYDLFAYAVARGDSVEPYRKQAYVFDQMNGAQSDGPAFLLNIHRVDSAADADAYVARLRT